MPKEQCAHNRDNDKFFEQFRREIVDRLVDKFGAIVGRHNLYARRQALLESCELLFHTGNRLAGVFTGAQDNDAASHFAFTVQFCEPTPDFGADLNARNIAQGDENTAASGL